LLGEWSYLAGGRSDLAGGRSELLTVLYLMQHAIQLVLDCASICNLAAGG